MVLEEKNIQSPVTIDVTIDARPGIICPTTCSACLSSDIFYLGAIKPAWKFAVENIPLLVCRTCGTCMTPHNMDTSACNGITWHLSVQERNRKFARQVLANLYERNKTVQQILEIGCGPGWLMHEASLQGIRCVGYETNQTAALYAQAELGLDVRCGIWDDTIDVNFDTLVCISVLEHLENPDVLLLPIAKACAARKALAVLSVPTCGLNNANSFLTRHIFPYLHDLHSLEPKNFLRLVPAHVTHYSHVGFIRHLERLGATSIQSFICGWRLYLCEFA